MRVLVLSNHSLDDGRRERLRAIAGVGCEVVLAIPGGTASVDGAVRLAPVPVKRNASEPDQARWHRGTIHRLITEFRPSLIHIEAEAETHLAVVGATLAIKHSVPYTIFGMRSRPASLGFLARRRRRHVLAGATGVLGPHRLSMELLHEQAPDAIAAAIPAAGVPLPPLADRRDGVPVFGFAARLVPERGCDIFLSGLSKTYGAWQAVIAGTGPEQERLEGTVQRLGLASRVQWLGGIRRDTMEAFWPEIDCLVVPMRDTPAAGEEPTPWLLEAMGRGLLPVVTGAGALPELVGRTGIVVSDPTLLHEALQPLVADPAACRARGLETRSWFLERYLTSVIADRTLTFWKAAVEHARSGTPASRG